MKQLHYGRVTHLFDPFIKRIPGGVNSYRLVVSTSLSTQEVLLKLYPQERTVCAPRKRLGVNLNS